MTTNNLNIKTKVLIPLALVLIVVVASMSGAYFLLEHHYLNNDFRHTLHDTEKSFKTVINSHAEQLNIALEQITANEQLIHHFLLRDRDALLKSSQKVFTQLHDEHGITHFYFHENNGQNFLRVHAPDRSGGMVKRETLRTAIENERLSYGVELGDMGTLTLRVIAPWYKDGNLLGYVELGEEVNKLLNEVRDIFDIDFYVTLDKRLLNRADWEAGIEMLGREGHWDPMSPVAVIAGTLPLTPQLLAEKRAGKDGDVIFTSFVTSNGDRLYHLGALPIVDASGRNVGEIVVMKDVTARMENIHETIRYVALIASALALLVFAFFYELLLRADHAIKADHARLTDDLGNQQKLFQAQIDQLENRALYDPLTELPNRTLFKDRLQHEIHVAQRDKKPIAVVLMTVTNMKSVADTLGHRVGDDVLKQIAWRLRQGLRKSDTIAKSGTDEFGALLPSVDLDLALDIVNKIDAMLRQSFMVNNVTVDLTTHIGVAIYPFHHQDPAALLRQADSAMRTARDEKLSYAIFDSTQESQKQKQLVLITDLHRAITNDDLELHYFPKVDIARGQVLGVEALLRWRHHDYGLIAPEEIIALAEKTGLIRTLTRWIVDKAIRQQATWLRANIDLAVAINISPLNLLDPFFSKQLEEMLLKRNVPMQNILLEISEQAITSDPAKLAGAMTKLSGQGFKFAIDDIGTGNSVLPYLKRLPVTEIKLDESLVYTLTDNSNNLAFVRSTIKLAHDLGIKVVAEGIKNKAILEQLTGLHCDIGQGYHINQPSNSSAFECWLVNSKYGAGVNSGAVCNIQDA